MLLTNARVYTLDPSNSTADTIVVRDGRIAFAGRREQINPDPGEPVHDLGGRTLLPGFTDAHAHLVGLAREGMALNVTGAPSPAVVAEKVAEAAAARPPGIWITGRGWDQTRWPDPDFPTSVPLDQATTAHPVCLTRIDGHAVWVNRAALTLAGIDAATPGPPGGRILRDGAGVPTGVLIDAAQELVSRLIPEPDAAAAEAALQRAIGRCLSLGLIGVHEMGVGLETLAMYRRLIERDAFPFRVYAALMGGSRTAWAHYRDIGPERHPSGRLTVRAVKLFADGALGSRGAAMHAPYSDEPDNSGLLLTSAEELEARLREIAAAGFQPCVHAIGDRANTLVLDAYERVLAEHPGQDRRFRVEHAQILAPADIPHFARLGVIASMQPTHCTSDMPWALARLGPERSRTAYAWRSLLDSGAVLAGGSDFPVESPAPLAGIHAAVTRRPREGGEPWFPEQRLTRLEAVRMFTTAAAYAAFEEAEAGSIAPGNRADLVVLDGDPFTCPEDDLLTMRVAMTLVAGEIVHQAE